jgi:thymidylate synthase (FAD)
MTPDETGDDALYLLHRAEEARKKRKTTVSDLDRTNTVTPQIFCLAQTILNEYIIRKWLAYLDGIECLEHVTGNAGEVLIELAGRRCYRSFAIGLNANVTKVRTDSKEYHRNILDSRHGSVLEHTSVTYAIEAVSRIFTHELVRHRAGTAFSQESMRYVRIDVEDPIDMWFPDELLAFPEVIDMMRAHNKETTNVISRIYDKLGFNKLPMMNFDKKKRLTSAVRRIVPDGIPTGIVFTANLRALRFELELRTAEGAEEEIRTVFNLIGMDCLTRFPHVFQDFSRKNLENSEVPAWIPKNSKV